MCMYLRVCMYVHTYVCFMYACVYVCMCVCMYVHVCMHVCMHIFMYRWMDGWIDGLMFAHVCIYRLGEMCSHVAALLFKVEACVRLGIATMTSTSLPCVWNQAFSKKVKLLVLKL